MKITVCELNTAPDAFTNDWNRLVAHVKSQNSDLVLLPEMPFCPWFAGTRQVDPMIWEAAVTAHDNWEVRLQELAPAIVLGSRPVNQNDKRLNQGFVWESQYGYRAAHTKYYLPDVQGFWEASWYDRGDGNFTPAQTSKAQVGFAICTDIWFTEHARAYGKKGVHLLANPRATRKTTFEKWLVAGRAAALVSGTFCISSNHFYFKEHHDPELGGRGWIIAPDGRIIGLTSPEVPFITAEIDLTEAEAAKQTYPGMCLNNLWLALCQACHSRSIGRTQPVAFRNFEQARESTFYQPKYSFCISTSQTSDTVIPAPQTCHSRAIGWSQPVAFRNFERPD